jgi:hypothetical protein
MSLQSRHNFSLMARYPRSFTPWMMQWRVTSIGKTASIRVRHNPVLKLSADEEAKDEAAIR